MPGPGPRGPRGPKPRVENPGKLMGRLLKYVGKNYGIHLVIVAVCIFVSVIANVQGTMFMKNLIDLYIMPLIGQSSPDFGPLLGAILKVAVFYLIGVLATFSYNRIMVYVTQGTLKNLRNDMFHHMESLPIKYFDTHAHGDIMSIYTNDIDTLRQMISQSMPQLLSSVITIVSVFVSMIILSIPLTLVSLVMIAIMLFTTKKVAGLSGRYFLAQQKSLGAVNGYIEEMMEGQKVVKVFCHEEESLEKFNQLNDELYDSANNANKYGNILGPVNAQLGNVSYVVCAIAGGIRAEKLAFLTDVEGVCMNPNDPTTLVSVLNLIEANKLIEAGIISGGMIPKIDCCVEAVRRGVHRAHILDGRIPHCLLLEIFTNKGIGTAIKNDVEERYYHGE